MNTYPSNYEQLKELSHNTLCETRRLHYLICSGDLEIAYKNTTKEEREKLVDAIKTNKGTFVKDLIVRKLLEGTPFEQLSIRKLQEIGKHIGIAKYYKLNKLTLVEEITNVAKALKSDSKREHIQPKQTNDQSKDTNGRGELRLLDHEGNRKTVYFERK